MDEKDVLDENQILPEKDAETSMETVTNEHGETVAPDAQTVDKPKRRRAPRKKTATPQEEGKPAPAAENAEDTVDVTSTEPAPKDTDEPIQLEIITDIAPAKPKRKRAPRKKTTASEDASEEKLPDTDTTEPDLEAREEKASVTPEAEDVPFPEKSGESPLEGDEPRLEPERTEAHAPCPVQNYTMFDGEELPAPSLDEIAYDDEPREKPDDDKGADGFNDFLASYRRRVAEMIKAAEGEDAKKPEGTEDATDVTKVEDNADLSPYPFFGDEMGGLDEEDAEDAEQLTIDLTDIPFTPLKESEKKPDTESDEYRYDPKKPGFINNLFDMIEIFVFTVAAVLFVSAFFFRHSMVDGGSMNDTLHDGEHLIITNLFYTPERGDIVVFEDYTVDKKPIVKRVIGIEGDTVRVEKHEGVAIVYLNGERLEESYALTDGYDSHPTGTWTVGEGELFVMGDHRNDSWDGRSFGLINADSVLGKAIFRFYPFDRFGTLD